MTTAHRSARVHCGNLAAVLALLALAVTTAPAHAYAIETAFGGQFSIAVATDPRDEETYRETYIDPAFIDEGFVADATPGPASRSRSPRFTTAPTTEASTCGRIKALYR